MDNPCRPTCPVSPDCRFGSYTATVPSATYFFCLARKSGQKEALGDAIYCALTRAIFWPLRGLNALFGRRIATVPIAYTSDKCTTRRRGQTASISVLLISGILGGSCSCTACCRGRWRAQPSATKERYGCGLPLAGAHRPAWCTLVSRKSAANSSVPNGPMWASAPTTCCAES